MIAVASLLVVVLVSLIVTRIATVALASTGMSNDAARFQARSALTGVGFTTTESESVVGHPIRRRVVMTLMLIGNAGLVTILGSLIFSFAGGVDQSAKLVRLGIIISGLVLIWLLSRSRRADRWLTRAAARYLSRHGGLATRPQAAQLHLAGDFAIRELRVREADEAAGRTLAEMRLPSERVVVLGIHRGVNEYVGLPTAETEVVAGDALVVYGESEALDRLEGLIAER